jgi:hypothetical protein
MTDEGDGSPFRYHLELNPKQLKITHTALRALADDFGHDEAEVHALIEEVLTKLPDEHAIRAIQLGGEQRAPEEILAEAPSDEMPPPSDIKAPPTGDDEPPDTVA